MNTSIDFFFDKEKKWNKEFEYLRKLILDCGLNEELKWGKPCYTFEGKNIVLMHGFKDYCALLFFKGSLLHDDEKILVQQTENVQAARQIRFTGLPQIVKLKASIKAYVYEAMELEKTGQKVKLKDTKEFTMPEEFEQRLKKDKALKKAFEALTPGRQRGYLFFFSQPKLSKTRETRIDNSVQQIKNGKGLND